MNNYVIYIHTNKFNNKKYVGMTSNIKKRWRNNGLAYRPAKNKKQLPFWNAINKYGWENFSHEIVEENLTHKEACERERYYIELYNTRDNACGYNVAEGGTGGRVYIEHPRGMLGKTHSEEWKRQQSERIKGENNPAYGEAWFKENEHPKSFLGKHHSDESKKKISEALKKIKHACQPVKVISPNGEEFDFDSIKQCAEFLNINHTSAMLRRLVETGKPFEIKQRNGHSKNLERLVGFRIIKLDNTEVTYETKAS